MTGAALVYDVCFFLYFRLYLINCVDPRSNFWLKRPAYLVKNDAGATMHLVLPTQKQLYARHYIELSALFWHALSTAAEVDASLSPSTSKSAASATLITMMVTQRTMMNDESRNPVGRRRVTSTVEEPSSPPGLPTAALVPKADPPAQAILLCLIPQRQLPGRTRHVHRRRRRPWHRFRLDFSSRT